MRLWGPLAVGRILGADKERGSIIGRNDLAGAHFDLASVKFYVLGFKLLYSIDYMWLFGSDGFSGVSLELV